MSLASIDMAVAPILTELQTKQTAALTKNSKFAQLFSSHDEIPSDTSLTPKTKEEMLRDEDIFPTLPLEMDFAFRVDETQHPDGKCGWVLWAWTTDESQTYVKTWVSGPEDHNYPSNWTLTDTELNQ